MKQCKILFGGASIQKWAKKVYIASKKHKIVNFEAQKVKPNL